MAKLKGSCKQALSFAKTFNLEVSSVTLNTKTTNEIININYDDSSPQNPPLSQTISSPPDHEVEDILYLLDSYGVSDQFYHELAMTLPSLPRSYKVKRVRESISSKVELRRLSSPYEGCYRSLSETLTNVVSVEVSKQNFINIKLINYNLIYRVKEVLMYK